VARSTSVVEVVLKGTDQSMTASLRSAQRESASLASSITALSTGYLAVSRAIQQAAGFIDGWIGASVRAAREVQSFSTRLGASVEGLQHLKFAAEQSNVAFGQVTIGLQRMTRRVAEAAKGTGEAQQAIKDLGLDAKALASLLPDEQFAMVAKALQQVTNQSDRVRLAFKLFDSEGVGLIQMFDEMGPSLDELSKRFDELTGGPLSAAEIKKLDDAGRAWSQLGTFFRSIGDDAAVALVGGLQSAGAAVEELTGQAGILERALIRLERLGGASGVMAEAAQRRTILALPEAQPQRRTTGVDGLPLRPKVLGAGPPSSFVSEFSITDDELARINALPDGIVKARDSAKGAAGAFDRMAESVQGIREPIIDLGMDWETVAETMTEEQAKIGQGYLDMGKSVQWVVENVRQLSRTDLRLAQRMQEAEEAARNLGATMVDVAFEFADNWANVMAQAMVGVTTFAEAAKQAFRNLAVAAIAELNRIIARAIVLATIKAILGFSSGGSIRSTNATSPAPANTSQLVAQGGIIRAAGGILIPGWGGGDRVPAMLEPGEFVLNRLAVQGMGMQNVAALNARRGQTFANSGGSSRSVNLHVSISTVMGSRGEAMAAANAFVSYAKASGALA
jgi:hypothetical protein